VTTDDFAPLFASDLGQQVRESFEEMIEFGASVSAATQETWHRFSGAAKDPQDGPVVLVAIAALQVANREVFASVRDAALGVLQDGSARRQVVGGSESSEVRQLLDDLQEILEALEIDEDEDWEDEDA
ncbi:MAG: hypothetical protein AAGK78_12930, partial [Planctomycetota bacterium]